MKKLIKYLLLCVMTISLFGCTNEDNKDLLDTIQERGTIIVATEGTWSPWTYHDENNKLVGFDVEVMEAIAEKLGVKCEFVVAEWDSLLAGVDSGRFDIVANGVEIDEDRKAKYDFTNPYGYIRTALIVTKDNTTIKTFEDLKGVGGYKLRYDFYLPTYNVLIEYQGKQHEEVIEYFGGEEKFKIQQEHDRRKREYAEKYNIKLLEIWYWDFKNIEEILSKELNLLIA